PPGPRGPVRIARALLARPTEFFEACAREHGDAFSFVMGAVPCYVFTDPAAIEQLLVRSGGALRKDMATRELSTVLGRGLLISEGERWRRARRLAAPLLSRRHVEVYADAMTRASTRFLARVRGELGRGDRDVHEDMMDLTLRIVSATLFGIELDADDRLARVVSESVETIMARYNTGIFGLLRVLFGDRVPLPRDLLEARQQLYDALDSLIEQRRAAPGGDDLLSRLLAARDDDGAAMSPQQLRDESITMFIAGHETTALTLTYAWWHVARTPGVLPRLRAELDALDGRPGVEDLPRLPYTAALVNESLRLYPPAWCIGRETLEDCVVAGYTIPRGAQIFLAPWLNHRDPRWFAEPLRFRPERWLGDLEASLPRFAFFPFGGGPRVCIGNHFARMEAILVLATLARELVYRPTRPQLPEFHAAVTLRPARAIPARPELRRSGAPA
ncbi:MAG: cytochrome P450, partial [Myxococcales bacterium]|nr:cytochrome P450 [Myxococcales bacterium]